MVTARDIANCDVTLSAEKMTYTGKALTPAITVKDGIYKLSVQSNVINYDTYTVEYKNNIKPGEATVVITGTKIYEGTVEESFVIVPKKATMSSVTSTGVGKLKVEWSKDSLADGYMLQYSTDRALTQV